MDEYKVEKTTRLMDALYAALWQRYQRSIDHEGGPLINARNQLVRQADEQLAALIDEIAQFPGE